jgi:ubiquinone/menaquinone biosynthesis C-methylase UbiE
MTDPEIAVRKYKAEASSYDAQYEKRTEENRRRTLALLRLTHGDIVIDAGCGTGLAFPIIEEAIGSSGKIIGIDQSPEMLTEARRRVEREGWRNVSLIECAVENAAIPVEADAAIFYATHDIMRTPTALENVIGHLKPGGRVLAAGLMWGKWWAVDANLRVFRMARRYVTTFEGLAKPWNRLEPLLSEIHVQRRIVRGLPAYVVVGRK